MTQQAFDDIAPGWYNFRHHTIFRTELETLAKRWGKGKLLNIGCGHGPDFLPFKEGFELYGIDVSAGMLQYAKKYALKYDLKVTLQQADARTLPFENETFDWAIAVASLHHLHGKGAIRTALIELKRALKPGGEAFITAWNRWQPRFWFKGKEVQVPWRAKEKTINRYYYLFSYAELEKLVKEAGFKLLKSFPESSYSCPVKFFSRNICLLVKKQS
jgi:tRNA (uracil-5-)-methyltransferase TRM9